MSEKVNIVTVHFEYPREAHRVSYALLHKVFKKSIELNAPACELVDIVIDPPAINIDTKVAFLSNTAKLREWNAYLQSQPEGARVIFADCDMLCNLDPSGLFDAQKFDIAYTHRTGEGDRYPFNGGILFVRATNETKKVFDLWYKANVRMMEDPEFHRPYRERYAGINQASWGFLLDEASKLCHIISVPCRIYNAVDSDWRFVNDSTVFIHYKSLLRQIVLRKKLPVRAYTVAQGKWDAIRELV